VRLRGPVRAFLLYGLATLPFGVLVHLLSEASALGFGRLHLNFLLGHLYLIVLAGAGFLSARRLFAAYHNGKRVHVAALRRDLPFHGRGWGFYLLAYAWQLGFFGLTIAVEHQPLIHGDWILGGIVALALAAAGSSALSGLAKRIEHLFSGWYLPRERRRLVRLRRTISASCSRIHLLESGYGTVLGSRPPPTLA
jgi:hypothetical protein